MHKNPAPGKRYSHHLGEELFYFYAYDMWEAVLSSGKRYSKRIPLPAKGAQERLFPRAPFSLTAGYILHTWDRGLIRSFYPHFIVPPALAPAIHARAAAGSLPVPAHTRPPPLALVRHCHPPAPRRHRKGRGRSFLLFVEVY